MTYARAGFYVLPIKPGTKNAGSVLGIGWPSKSSRDLKIVADWWREHPDAGIGIHTGRSGIVVFDVDVDTLPSDLAPLQAGLIHRSRAGTDSQRGHYIFAAAEIYTAGALRLSDGTKAGEVRSGNTIIVVEPTHHANGGLYRCEHPGEVPTLTAPARQLLLLAPKIGDSDVGAFLAAYPGNEGDNLAYCLKLAVRRFNHLVRNYEDTGISNKRSKNRHDAMADVLCLTLKEAHTQAYSAAEAVAVLRQEWRKAVEGDANHSEADIDRMLPFAVAAANDDDPMKRREIMGRRYGTDTRTTTPNVQAGQAASIPTGQKVPSTKNLISDAHSAGQIRMSGRFVDFAEGRLLHVEDFGWYYFGAGRWQPDVNNTRVTSAILKMLKKCWEDSFSDSELEKDVRRCQSTAGVAGIRSLCASLPEFSCSMADFDTDPHLLNFSNGTLNLRTMDLHKHTPADRITKICRGNYDPQARSQHWDSFLARIQPDSAVRDYLQRIVGSALVGEVREDLFVILYGTAMNGKTRFDGAVRNALGNYAAVADRNVLMNAPNAHPTLFMVFRGARWVSVDETNRSARIDEAKMKMLTGNSVIPARGMRKDFIEIKPSHTLSLITNYLPRISGDDAGSWRRIKVIPFSVRIPESEMDPALASKLDLEADAILAWAVAGWAKYRDQGLVDVPKAVQQQTDDYWQSNDEIGQFIGECCDVAPDFKESNADLRRSYESWCHSEQVEPMPVRLFNAYFDHLGYVKTKGGERKRRGIRLARVT
ncbi:phage/plasmid primase, P4 family [Mycolicibacterium aurum]|uniref:phage/plasmid primase, P4 family n=1 Tax=Mycolicibacterium aurum TaxID=1791 RepID=UPI001476975D|nr:phage/plasmid primase, P4 family [Mycolicibacterium aurum]